MTVGMRLFVFLSIAMHAALLQNWRIPAPVSYSSAGTELQIRLSPTKTVRPTVAAVKNTPPSNVTSVQKTVGTQKSPSYKPDTKTIIDNKPPVEIHSHLASVAPTQKPVTTQASTLNIRSEKFIASSSPPVDAVSQIIERIKTDEEQKTQIGNSADNQQIAIDTSATEDRLRDRLQQQLSRHFKYPKLARRRGWQGDVKLELRIEASGKISRIQIMETSGHAILDRAARQTLIKIASLDNVDQWLQGKYFDMVLPVHYRLIDS